MPGGVRVESGVECAEAYAEQHGADDHHPHRRGEGLGAQGERDEQAEGGTGQGDAQVRQAGEQHGRHGENFLVRVVRTGSPCRESEQHAMTDGFLASARAGLPGHLSSSKVYIA